MYIDIMPNRNSHLAGGKIVKTTIANLSTCLREAIEAFRCVKSLDLQVRPIRHRSEAHVRAHIFLCMLAYYVQWRMKKGFISRVVSG